MIFLPRTTTITTDNDEEGEKCLFLSDFYDI